VPKKKILPLQGINPGYQPRIKPSYWPRTLIQCKKGEISFQKQGWTAKWLSWSYLQAVLAFKSFPADKPSTGMKYIKSLMWSDWQVERHTSITHSHAVTQLVPMMGILFPALPITGPLLQAIIDGVTVSTSAIQTMPSWLSSVHTGMWFSFYAFLCDFTMNCVYAFHMFCHIPPTLVNLNQWLLYPWALLYLEVNHNT
jgi:hypothetical protein